MRVILIFLIMLSIINPCHAFGFLQKKDYKQMFLDNAYNAEKRHDNKSAFHSYEKAIYYYKKDRKVIEAYAQFCERQKYFDKAENLYQKLYVLTKEKQYLFKVHLCAIKNGKSSNKELSKLAETQGLTSSQKNELNSALIYHFSYKKDWNNVYKTCEKLPKNLISKDIISTCIIASEKKGEKKISLGYYLRFYQFYANDSATINKIISLAEQSNDYPIQEEFIKKLSELNPKDNGIKYRLAGLYEKHGDYKTAVKIYKELIASGDKSEHVKKSLSYDLSESSPKKRIIQPSITYAPKPLTPKELKEKAMYETLKKKDYGIFTGRAADNKFYLEAQGKLPHQIYSYARAAYGVITAQNLVTNQYFEGYVGVGKLLYNNPRNKWINTFATDIVSYNSAYQYNLLNIYSSTGALFGGYFSPSYFNATTANLKLEGHFNKLPLRYGLKGFGGIQNALTPDQTTPTWGYSPYVSYAINDKISIYAAYNHFNYADVQRDQFIFSAVIKLFKKNTKK